MSTFLSLSSLQRGQHSFSTGEVTIRFATAARFQHRSIIKIKLETGLSELSSLALSCVCFGPHQSLITYPNRFLLVRHRYWQSGPQIHCCATARFKGAVLPVLLPTMVYSVVPPPNFYPKVLIIPEAVLPRFSSCQSG